MNNIFNKYNDDNWTHIVGLEVHVTQVLSEDLTRLLLPPVGGSVQWRPTIEILHIQSSSSLHQLPTSTSVT